MKNGQLSFISNKTNTRLVIILQYIERNRTFTLKELADRSNSSERTIASDVKYLKEYFGDSVRFHSGSKGYYFEEIHLTRYKEQKILLFENECLFEIVKNIFYNQFDSISELAYKYSFSETAFRRLLTRTNELLESYGLSWQSPPLKIGGEEPKIRKFFKDFFYEGIETPYTVIPDKRVHELFIEEGNMPLGNYELGTGSTPQSFYYTLYIAMVRSSQGNHVSIPENLLNRVYLEPDFRFLLSRGKEIEKSFQLDLPKEELAWVFLNLICQRTVEREDQERIFYERFNLWPQIEQVTKRFLSEKRVLGNKQQQIIPFINSFFLSRKINELVDPVLNKELLNNAEELKIGINSDLERNIAFLQQEQEVLPFNQTYFYEICASFTLYSNVILNVHSTIRTIFFLLEGNHFVCQAIRMEAQQLFGAKHQLKFVPIQLLAKNKLLAEGSDLIVTNYDRYVSEFIDEQEYVLIKTIPDEQDWSNIEERLLSID